MSLAVQTYVRAVFKDTADLRGLTKPPSERNISLAFFLLQATHARGARNGGGLNLVMAKTGVESGCSRNAN